MIGLVHGFDDSPIYTRRPEFAAGGGKKIRAANSRVATVRAAPPTSADITFDESIG
jgi:hypothetical protein